MKRQSQKVSEYELPIKIQKQKTTTDPISIPIIVAT